MQIKACACVASSASHVHVWLFLPVFSQKGEALVFAGRGSIATSWPPVWSKVNIWREATVQAGTWGGALLVLLPPPLPPPPPCTVVGQTPLEARRGQGCCCCRDVTVHLLRSFFFPRRGPAVFWLQFKRQWRITRADHPLQVYFIPTRMNTKSTSSAPPGLCLLFRDMVFISGASTFPLDFVIQVQVLFCVARESEVCSGICCEVSDVGGGAG